MKHTAAPTVASNGQGYLNIGPLFASNGVQASSNGKHEHRGSGGSSGGSNKPTALELYAGAMSASDIVAVFMQRLVPLGECPELLGYSHQYGRRMILELAVIDEDIYDIHGRWYVSREFLDKLADRSKNDAA